MRVRSTDDFKSFHHSTDSTGSPFSDIWRKQRKPDGRALVEEYESTAYTCANLNAGAVDLTKLRLFVRTDRRTDRRTRWSTAPISTKQRNWISTKLRLSSAEEIEEVTSHPVLDLLASPNDEIDGCQLFEVTQLYQEIVGTAFWWLPLDALGRPANVFYLKSQYMRPVRDRSTGELQAFELGGPQNGVAFTPIDKGRNLWALDAKGMRQVGRLVWFAMPNLHDEIMGRSPLAAVWESVDIASKMDATQAALLDNNARPDLVVSPKGEGYMGDAEQQRYDLRFRQKFQKGGNGGILFLDEEANITPLNFSPRDLSIRQFKGDIKIEICNAFGVPVAMVEGNTFNRATLDASRLQHALNGILPRLKRMEARLNKFVLPLYDDSGRLFFAFDDPSPENRQEKKAEVTGLVQANIITRNEARREYGLPEHDEGNDLFPLMPGMQGLEGSEESDDAEATTDAPDVPQGDTPAEGDNIQQTALNGSQIASLVEIATQVAEGLLPPDTARAIIGASFPTLTSEQINAIVGPLLDFEPRKPEADSEPPQPPDDDDPEDDPSGPPDSPTGPQDGDSAAAPQPGKLWLPPGVEVKTHDPLGAIPEGEALAEVVADFFKRKRLEVVANLTKGYAAKAALPESFVGLDDWTDELAEESKPVLELFVDAEAKALIERVGASPDVFDVTNPKMQDAISRLALAFAESTISTTTKELNTALSELRESIGEGLTAGDRLSDLTKRVNEVFEGLTKDRAFQIATTEASRAHHLGLRLAAKESGVVKGFRFMLSADPCEQCKAIADNNPEIGLDDFFTHNEKAPEAYQQVFVPVHPRCRCSVTEVLI